MHIFKHSIIHSLCNMTFYHHVLRKNKDRLFDGSVVCSMAFRSNHQDHREMHPPPSVLHAMRCLYGIGLESWVREMSRHALASLPSSHGVEEYSVSAVWPLVGIFSGRPPTEIIVVEQTAYLMYNVIVGRGWRPLVLSPRQFDHAGPF